MSSIISTFKRNLKAERLKLKNAPLRWITILSGFIIPCFIFILYYLGIVSENQGVGAEPWNAMFGLGLNMLAYLLIVPFVVLVASSIVNIEHTSNAWKQLYTLPQSRGHVYLSKFMMAIILVGINYLLFIIGMLAVGYALSVLNTGYNFEAYSPDLMLLLKSTLYSFMMVLGMLSIQYWLSTRFKNYLLALGLGMFAFIISITLSSKPDIGQYFPYSYPMFVSPENSGGQLDRQSSYVMVSSLVCCVLFVILGFYKETKGDVK